MTAGFSTNQRGIAIGVRIDIVNDGDNLTSAYLDGAVGYIELRAPDGSTKELPATSLQIEDARLVVIGYDDRPSATGRSPPTEPIFHMAGYWEKGGRIEWSDGRILSVSRNERVMLAVS